MRRLFALLLLPVALPAQQITDIRILPPIAHRWSLMYREFTTEWLDCVYGRIDGGTLLIVAALPADAPPSVSTPNNTDGLCVPLDTLLIGDAHNHPQDVLIRSQSTPSSGERFHVLPGTDQCYLSPQDWQTFMANAGQQVSVVICGQGEFIAFLRNREGARCRYDPEARTPRCLLAKP